MRTAHLPLKIRTPSFKHILPSTDLDKALDNALDKALDNAQYLEAGVYVCMCLRLCACVRVRVCVCDALFGRSI